MLTIDLWSLLGLLTLLPLFEDVHDGFGGQVLVDVLVVYLDHGCVHASTEAFDLAHGEESVC